MLIYNVKKSLIIFGALHVYLYANMIPAKKQKN